MAMNNRERVGRAFDLLSEGLYDVVDEVMTKAFGSSEWIERWAEADARRHGSAPRALAKQDVQVQLRAITERGYEFKEVLSRACLLYTSDAADD